MNDPPLPVLEGYVYNDADEGQSGTESARV